MAVVELIIPSVEKNATRIMPAAGITGALLPVPAGCRKCKYSCYIYVCHFTLCS